MSLNQVKDVLPADNSANMVMDAISILMKVDFGQKQLFGDVISQLEKAQREDKLVLIYSGENIPIAFAVISSAHSGTEETAWLECFVCEKRVSLGAMRMLRFAMSNKGIFKYMRKHKLGGSKVCSWKHQNQSSAQETVDDLYGVLEELKDRWECTPYPGMYGTEVSNDKEALEYLQTYLVQKQCMVENGRFIVVGDRTGEIVEKLLAHSPSAVLCCHSDPYDFFKAANRFARSQNVVHNHRLFELERSLDQTFDGAFLIAASLQGYDLDHLLDRLRSGIKPGGSVVVADYYGETDQGSVSSSSVNRWSANEVLGTLSKSGFKVRCFEDRSQDLKCALNDVWTVARRFEDHPMAVHPLQKLKDTQVEASRGLLNWGIWEADGLDCMLAAPSKVNMYPETVLVMLSGGIDSIYVLWDCLKNTDFNVVAHHINLANKEQRHIPESQASREVAAWCHEHIRGLKYTESDVNRSDFRFFGFDMFSVGFEAGLAAQHYRFENNHPVSFWQIGHCKEEDSWPGRWQYVENCLKAASFPFEAPVYREFEVVSKAEQVKRLPSELTSLSWGCRRPINNNGVFEPCRECQTCKDREQVGLK